MPTQSPSPQDIDAWVRAIATDYTGARLSPIDRALCDFAARLTTVPASVTKDHVEELRRLSLGDRAINDAVQTIAYFNYINRVADGLGVDLEPGMPPA